MDVTVVRHANAVEARLSALEEAVGTGSTVVPITSIERFYDKVVLIGSIKVNLVENINTTSGRTILRPIIVGNLHIYEMSYDEVGADILGYLVLQRPLTLQVSDPVIDSIEANVAIPVKGKEVLDRLNYFGRRCCKRCNGNLARERLEAVPDATLCVNCKRIVEGGHYVRGRKNGWAN